ncbi:hypothetical protein L3X38_004495 [Prunus dulcis]|uniref:DNAse I-like superfamily protein n=1 Tax=Prunus dulcis TaxID=3755 RepID=A0AAD5F391_PRUDU|nr:hypothetical protein L3X38_004495 [Prunus dulcis]
MVFERLNRAISNLQWRGLFPEAHVQYLPGTESDHNPIKIGLTSSFRYSLNNRPFRFKAMWMKHEGFADFIEQRWPQLSDSALRKSYGLVEPLK